MTEQKMFDTFKKILSKSNIDKLEEKLILPIDNGYLLFGEYLIFKKDGLYWLTKYKTDVEHTFFLLRNAVIWASLYKNNKIVDANRVLDLDKELQGTNFDIELQQNLSKKTKNLDNYAIYITKIVESKHRRDQIKKELESYEQSVKKWQFSQFAAITS